MQKKILIIDDNFKLCKSLVRNFEQRGCYSLFATQGGEAISLFFKQAIDLVLLDMMLGEENGLDILQELLRIRPDTPVIMITGYGSIDTAVQAMKLGALDYVTKPLDFEKLFNLVENAFKMKELNEENQQLKERLNELSPQIITRNKKTRALCKKAEKLAVTDLPILITGENGTGKEVLADFIHLHSPRNVRKMHKINCAAFPESLLDNELFGHEKGAYTGADSLFKGVFERAHQSSLFLDELGDMPLTIQAKILRTLQNHEIRRLGGQKTITVDVRFIAATNKDLETLLGEKTFRQDLFYRLNTAMLHIPPLRERREDIPFLTDHFLADYAHVNSTPVKQVSDRVLARFLTYHWPGNVRELKNTVNYAAAISSGDIIENGDLPPSFTPIEQTQETDNIREEIEKNLIIKILQKSGYNKKKAAELLNISRKTLYNKLAKYGITTPK